MPSGVHEYFDGIARLQLARVEWQLALVAFRSTAALRRSHAAGAHPRARRRNHRRTCGGDRCRRHDPLQSASVGEKRGNRRSTRSRDTPSKFAVARARCRTDRSRAHAPQRIGPIRVDAQRSCRCDFPCGSAEAQSTKSLQRAQFLAVPFVRTSTPRSWTALGRPSAVCALRIHILSDSREVSALALLRDAPRGECKVAATRVMWDSGDSLM